MNRQNLKLQAKSEEDRYLDHSGWIFYWNFSQKSTLFLQSQVFFPPNYIIYDISSNFLLNPFPIIRFLFGSSAVPSACGKDFFFSFHLTQLMSQPVTQIFFYQSVISKPTQWPVFSQFPVGNYLKKQLNYPQNVAISQ